MSQVVKEQSACLPGTNIKAAFAVWRWQGPPHVLQEMLRWRRLKRAARAEWSGMYRFPPSLAVSPPPRHQRERERESCSSGEI